jgi:periplasmic protein TonB
MNMNMTSQASTVVDIFTQKNVVNVDTYAAALPAKKRELNGLPLQVTQLPNYTEKKSAAWLTIALVLLAHALVIYLLTTQKPLEKIQASPVKPMMVSIIAPPSPEPEIVPIIEPPKPEPKPIIKPKKVVEKILPTEKPVERLIEATTEPPKEEIAKPEAAPVLAAEPAQDFKDKAPPKAVPIVEEKYEEPRFGVAYLNNPKPDYPALSVRKGEEGRVLMRVLVSADGTPEDVQIEKSSGFDRLDNAAVAAVKKWRFVPAKRNNQALSAYVLVPMPFILEN